MISVIFLIFALAAGPDALLFLNTQDPLERTQELYEAAAYEEALAGFPSTPPAGQEDDVGEVSGVVPLRARPAARG